MRMIITNVPRNAPVLPVAGALVLAGCGTSPAAQGSASAPSGATGTTDSVAATPVTLRDDCGRDVAVASPPERAVALEQGATEVMLSLGLADRMVDTSYLMLSSAFTADAAGARAELAEAQVPTYVTRMNCEDASLNQLFTFDAFFTEITDVAAVFDDITPKWGEVSWEEIAQRDPDVVVIADLTRGRPGDSASDKRKILAEDPVASKLSAVDPSVRSVDVVPVLSEALVAQGFGS